MFLPLSHSVHRGMYPSMQWGRGCLPLGPKGADTPLDTHLPWPDTPPPKVKMTIEAGGTHPTGMRSCLHLIMVTYLYSGYGKGVVNLVPIYT